MLRQVACLALILSWAVACATPAASAQDSDGRPPSLSDRLEQFRDDLLGQPSKPPSSPTKKTRKTTAPTSGPPLASTQPQSQGPNGPGVANGPASAPTQETQGPNDQVTQAADNGAPSPPPAAAPSKAAPAGGPSSRRTAQPNYKSFKAPPRTEVAAEPQSKFPTATPPDAAEAIEGVEDSGMPGKSISLPLPRIARAGTPGSASAASEPEVMSQPEATREPEVTSEPETTTQPEATTLPEKRSPSHHRAPRKASTPIAAPTKDVLLSGRTPALAIEAIGPRKVMIGREATFKVMLQNTGDVAANNVTVTLDIPPGAEVVDVQTTAGINQPIAAGDATKPLAWEISRLAGHGHETLTLKLIPRQNTPIDLAVHWACTPENGQMSLEVQEPKLAMSLSGPAEVLYGQSRSYKLIISNPGNGDAENVVVSLMPIGRAAEAAASHRLGTLTAGGSKSIEVELTARQAGELMIRAQALADSGLTAEVAEKVLVRRANLQLDVEGPKMKFAGTKGVYRIRLVNNGNAVAENVHVSAVLPPQATYQSSSAGGHVEAEKRKIVWTAGNLQPAEERLLEVQCVLQAPGENRLQVASSASQELTVSGGAITMVESLADLKLEVHDPQGPIATGEDAVYEVVIRNRGSKAAENVDLVLFFSSGLEATSVQGGPHEIGPGQVVLKSIPALPPGSEKTFKIHARADRAGNHVFRAEVVCAPLEIKLTSEQSTRFYGDDASESSTPLISRRPEKLEPVPVQ